MTLVFLFSLLVGASPYSMASPADSVFQKMAELNKMREGLASSLDHKKDAITEETFKQTCMPVGKSFKEWGEKSGYIVRQVARKNRNPNHALTTEEEKIFDLFLKDSKKQSHIVQVNEPSRKGEQLYYRIPIVSSCLHCHGENEKRPDFIKAKYPADKAYDFKPGDLRGLYSIFIAKEK